MLLRRANGSIILSYISVHAIDPSTPLARDRELMSPCGIIAKAHNRIRHPTHNSRLPQQIVLRLRSHQSSAPTPLSPL